MIKIILCILFFLMFWIFVVYYWGVKDFNTSAIQFFIYLGLIPFLFTFNFLFSKVRPTKKENKDTTKDKSEILLLDNLPKEKKLEKMSLFFYHAQIEIFCGKNLKILENSHQYQSPNLDKFLKNCFGVHINSYKILTIDIKEKFHLNKGVKRIDVLIKEEIIKHQFLLATISGLINKSQHFFAEKPILKYEIHPKWKNLDFSSDIENEVNLLVQPKHRVDTLNIYILLSKYWKKDFDGLKVDNIINETLILLSFPDDHIHIDYHFLETQDCYESWLNLLENISKHEYGISFVIAVDSEIDEHLILKKTANNQKYIPSEFITSCFISSQLLPDLEEIKKVTIIKNVKKMKESLKFLKKENLQQYQNDQPFLLLLDEFLTHSQHVKFDEIVCDTSIGIHHILNIPNYLGDTQNLADIWKFMLGLQLPKEITSMVVSIAKTKNQIFIESIEARSEEYDQPT